MISFKAGVLAIAPIHRSNAVISCCCKLSAECNRERVRDKQQGGDKERQSIRGRMERGANRSKGEKGVSVKSVQQDALTVKLLKEKDLLNS